jgi:signal transduction histidine kinase
MVFFAQQAVLHSVQNKNNLPSIAGAYALSELAYALWYAGNYPDAKETYFKALEKAEPLEDTLLLGTIYNGLAIVNRYEGDFRQAINYHSKAEALTKLLGDNDVLFSAIVDKAKAYEQLNILDSAYNYAQEALAMLFRKYGDKNVIGGGVHSNMGSIYSKQGKGKLAEEYFRRSFQLSTEVNELRLLARAYVEFAEHFDRNHQRDSAIFYASKGLIIDQQFGFLVQQLAASTLLTKLYSQENRIDSAFKYQQLMVKTKDSVFSREKINRLQSLEFEQQLRQNDLAAQRAAFRNKIQLYALLGFGLFFLTIALLLYRNNRQKQRSNTLLHQQKTVTEQEKIKVEEALMVLKATQAQLVQREKMASLGELTAGIAHEIQNPLNFVNNFSEINSELIDELKQEAQTGNTPGVIQLADELKENEQKIASHGKRADAIVKGMLQHSRTNTGDKEPTNINALVDEYVRLSYHGLRAKDKTFEAQLQTDFDPTMGKANVVPQDLGRVLLNLFNNAFYATAEKKKRLNGTYAPVVSVRTKRSGDQVEIQVQDNGTGIPKAALDKIFQPFFTTKPSGEGTGLGLSLSYDIITKGHGGELTVQSEEGEGATFVVRLPA